MNRVLGKLIAELPKEMCWEGAVSESTSELCSPVSRTYKQCQGKMMSQTLPNQGLKKYKSTVELKNKRELDYYPNQIQASMGGTSIKHDLYIESVKKPDDYERWLKKGVTSVRDDPHGKKPSTPLVLHRQNSPSKRFNATDSRTSYLPPRLIPNPEVALRSPREGETLVSLTDRTPPSMQKWAQQMNNGEQYDWLREIDEYQGLDELDDDIRALQMAMTGERASTKKQSLSESPRKVDKKEKVVTESRKRLIDFDSKNPLERLLAHRTQINLQKTGKNPEEPKPTRLARSVSSMANLSPSQLPKEIRAEKPPNPSLGQSHSSVAFKPSNYGSYLEKFKAASRPFSPTRTKIPKKVNQLPPTPPLVTLNEALSIEYPAPTVKHPVSAPERPTSHSQQCSSPVPTGPSPSSREFWLKLDESHRAFETDERNLQIFREMAESESNWSWHRGSTASIGSMAELSGRYELE